VGRAAIGDRRICGIPFTLGCVGHVEAHVGETQTSSCAKAERLSDEEVVDRVRSGEGALFEVLMRRHNQRLFRAARSIVKDDAEAEDVMQQAYVNAYTHLDQFAQRATFSTWLTRIAVHEALARLKHNGRFTDIDPALDDESVTRALPMPALDPEQQAQASELRRFLEAALDALSPRYHSVVMLREVEGLSTLETAACLGITEETVKTRLHRARGLLRRLLSGKAGLAARDAFPFPAPRCDRIVASVLVRQKLVGATHASPLR
jgi:RNA polymerase sigma-70 factor, ECF subfamily